MFDFVSGDVFAVVADPTRRRILHELIDHERSVGELVGSLGLSQPAVSKHLKVLRDHGFVASRTAAQQRIYRLDQLPFAQLDAWLGPFRRKWNRHLDALERHLADGETRDAPKNQDDLETKTPVNREQLDRDNRDNRDDQERSDD